MTSTTTPHTAGLRHATAILGDPRFDRPTRLLRLQGWRGDGLAAAPADQELARDPHLLLADRAVELEEQPQAIEPERYLSFRWVPYGIEVGVDPQTEPQTLVEFSLQARDQGTQVQIVESGFDQLNLERKRRAFLMNAQGWQAQLQNIERYLGAT